MAIRDDVEDFMRRHPGSTAREISAALFGLQDGYQQRVNPICVDLCESGRAHRRGAGTRNNPFTYYHGEPEP